MTASHSAEVAGSFFRVTSDFMPFCFANADDVRLIASLRVGHVHDIAPDIAQSILLQAHTWIGKYLASAFTVTGSLPGARRSLVGLMPRPTQALGASGAVPGAHTVVPGRMPTA